MTIRIAIESPPDVRVSAACMLSGIAQSILNVIMERYTGADTKR